MALIDVVKCDIMDGEFVNKFPSEDLRIGTQLVVHPSQTAFFVKGGTIYDEFTAGTYTIKTENVPFLNKAVNLPFGGDAPNRCKLRIPKARKKMNSAVGNSCFAVNLIALPFAIIGDLVAGVYGCIFKRQNVQRNEKLY